MTIEEFSIELRIRYDEAKINEAAMQIHLFGIEYGLEIKKEKYKVADIIKLSGLGKGYAAELSKGIKLSGHVVVKER